MSPYWVAYFATESCAGTSAKATELGGNVLMSATEVPAGKFAAISDPQGAVFAIFERDFDD
jgi:predicted enzyme related to lactoylglutathione lyase